MIDGVLKQCVVLPCELLSVCIMYKHDMPVETADNWPTQCLNKHRDLVFQYRRAVSVVIGKRL